MLIQVEEQLTCTDFFSTFRSGISKVKEQIFSEHSYASDHKELYYTCCHLKLTSFKRSEFIQ